MKKQKIKALKGKIFKVQRKILRETHFSISQNGITAADRHRQIKKRLKLSIPRPNSPPTGVKTNSITIAKIQSEEITRKRLSR